MSTTIQPNLLDILLSESNKKDLSTPNGSEQQLANSQKIQTDAELLAHGLLGLAPNNGLNTQSFDCSLISSLSSLPTQSITYSSPLTYTNPFLTASLLQSAETQEKENQVSTV